MQIGENRIEDLFQLAPNISVAVTEQHVNLYDFDFRKFFAVTSIFGEIKSQLILRIGALHSYSDIYESFLDMGLQLINSVEQHNLVTYLPNWYPKIAEFTPRSIVYSEFPSVQQIENNFLYPIFIKGERQTNKHNKALCIAESRDELHFILDSWGTDEILNWQKVIVREFVKLQAMEPPVKGELQKSLEFRAFVWFGQLLSIGAYWPSESKPILSFSDKQQINKMIALIYSKIQVPFMVIDFGKTVDEEWIVIELNDAQESGYAMNSKMNLWTQLIQLGIPQEMG